MYKAVIKINGWEAQTIHYRDFDTLRYNLSALIGDQFNAVEISWDGEGEAGHYLEQTRKTRESYDAETERLEIEVERRRRTQRERIQRESDLERTQQLSESFQNRLDRQLAEAKALQETPPTPAAREAESGTPEALPPTAADDSATILYAAREERAKRLADESFGLGGSWGALPPMTRRYWRARADGRDHAEAIVVADHQVVRTDRYDDRPVGAEPAT